MNTASVIIKLHGITKDPETNNFMMVMDYAYNGSLRQSLNKNFIPMNWSTKFNTLVRIADGLNDIHKNGLIHQDFHSGNILLYDTTNPFITDLGLCIPANEK